jgi:hypothetical protein
VRARTVLAAATWAALSASVLAGCGHSASSSPSSPSRGAIATAPAPAGEGVATTAPAVPRAAQTSRRATATAHAPAGQGAATTASPVPRNAQTSAEEAAAALVGAWAEGERAAAIAVGTPTAVATLFSHAYPGGDLAVFRGCAGTPATCSYGPPGSHDPGDAVYQLTTAQTGGYFVVSAVTVQTP